MGLAQVARRGGISSGGAELGLTEIVLERYCSGGAESGLTVAQMGLDEKWEER
jgi:hypothetical protein